MYKCFSPLKLHSCRMFNCYVWLPGGISVRLFLILICCKWTCYYIDNRDFNIYNLYCTMIMFCFGDIIWCFVISGCISSVQAVLYMFYSTNYIYICWCRGYSTLYCVLVHMSFYYLVLLNLDCGLTYCCLVFIFFCPYQMLQYHTTFY